MINRRRKYTQRKPPHHHRDWLACRRATRGPPTPSSTNRSRPALPAPPCHGQHAAEPIDAAVWSAAPRPIQGAIHPGESRAAVPCTPQNHHRACLQPSAQTLHTARRVVGPTTASFGRGTAHCTQYTRGVRGRCLPVYQGGRNSLPPGVDTTATTRPPRRWPMARCSSCGLRARGRSPVRLAAASVCPTVGR